MSKVKFNVLDRTSEKTLDPENCVFGVFYYPNKVTGRDKGVVTLNSTVCYLMEVWTGSRIKVLDIPGEPDRRFIVKTEAGDGYKLIVQQWSKNKEEPLGMKINSRVVAYELLKAFKVKDHKASFRVHRTGMHFGGHPVFELKLKKK